MTWTERLRLGIDNYKEQLDARPLALPLSIAYNADHIKPADAPKTTDLSFALKVIRASRGEGVWLLKDPQAHLENALRRRA